MPDDTRLAEGEREARRRLLEGGAADLPRPPWLSGRQPPSDVDLLRHVLWRFAASGRGVAVTQDDALAALALLPRARAELDQVEAAVLFTARAEGLTWAQIAEALGLGSSQAAQQRAGRLTARTGGPG